MFCQTSFLFGKTGSQNKMKTSGRNSAYVNELNSIVHKDKQRGATYQIRLAAFTPLSARCS